MSHTIALAGKGGTGKTTISALLIDYLRKTQSSSSILTIDADPNSNLNQVLGVELNDTVVGILDKLAGLKDGPPSGMTKNRFIEYEVQNSVSESKGFDLLAMGRPEGPGCYCYVNSVLRGLIDKLSKAYDFVVIDNEAGMEHLSRRIEKSIDTFFIISDYSRVGVRSAKRISDLAEEMKLKIGSKYLIVNMADGDISLLKEEIKKTGLKLAGIIPFDKEIENLSLAGKSIINNLEKSKASGLFTKIMASIKFTQKEAVTK
ncbi:MAG: AAA family ATPase [Candidatus Omnitrophica bacterium]|nr:AAA family ATPase [Candidatus Omnitrophota bacterium]